MEYVVVCIVKTVSKYEKLMFELETFSSSPINFLNSKLIKMEPFSILSKWQYSNIDEASNYFFKLLESPCFLFEVDHLYKSDNPINVNSELFANYDSNEDDVGIYGISINNKGMLSKGFTTSIKCIDSFNYQMAAGTRLLFLIYNTKFRVKA